MPWVPPVRRSAGGDTVQQAGGAKTFSIQANAGDLVVITLATANYPLVISSITGGGISWATHENRERGSGYGNAYTFSGTSPTTQTFTLTVTTVNYVNATVYYQLIRWYVFGSHGGPGYSGAWRAGGEPWLYVNQSTEKSAFVHTHVDWNATSPTGAWLTDCGPPSDGVVARHAEGIYWACSHLDSTGINQKRLGVAGGATSTRITGAGLEIKGIYSDTSPPTVVPNVDAIAMSSSEIRVDWGAPTDDVGVTKYRVYDNGVQVGADIPVANARTFFHTGLTPESTHVYTVRALDAVGNISPVSASKTVMTKPLEIDKLRLGIAAPKLYVGTAQVDKVYLGDTQIWP